MVHTKKKKLLETLNLTLANLTLDDIGPQRSGDYYLKLISIKT